MSREIFEVRIVDNNSTDNTAQVVEGFTEPPLNAFYHRERNQGLSHARNLGWQVSRGRFVGYIDDECTLPAGWLSAAREIANQINPEMFGGPYRPRYDVNRPVWFKDEYANRSLGEKARFLDLEYLSGGNMFIRKDVFEDIGGFDPSLGMCGGRQAYGEETEFHERLRSRKPDARIYYDPGLMVSHLVRKEKLSVRHELRRRFITGREHVRSKFEKGLLPEAKSNERRRLLAEWMWQFKALVKVFFQGMLRRDRVEYPFFHNFMYEVAGQKIETMGMLFEESVQLGKKPHEA